MTATNRQSSLATILRRRRLAAPVAVLAEIHRPLAPLLGDLLTFLSPLLTPLVGGQRVDALTTCDGYDTLLEELTAPDEGGGG
jgi:hypothetical protein